jgi:hypothetical protein
MTNEEEWAARIARAKYRFFCPTYVIHNQYTDPNSPYFAPGYYLDGGELAKLITTPRKQNGLFDGGGKSGGGNGQPTT